VKRGKRWYRRRKAIAELPFGWIKHVLGFRRFSLRGLEKVRGEWQLVCAALNLKRNRGPEHRLVPEKRSTILISGKKRNRLPSPAA